MTGSLTIGEFSKLTHLSTKTLRHYHDIGLLVPAAVDESSRYRRYDSGQVHDAQLIRRLRALDMPTDDVRAVLGAADPATRSVTIAAHLVRMEDELDRTRQVVASLRALLDDPAPHLHVERRRLPGIDTLAIRDNVARDDIGPWCAAAFGELSAASADATPTGPGGGLFSARFFEHDEGDVVAYVPITERSSVTTGRVENLTIEPVDVVVATHAGPFEDLDRTYAAVGAYANELGVAADAPIREIYLVGPDTVHDPMQFRTEVCWPVHTKGST